MSNQQHIHGIGNIAIQNTESSNINIHQYFGKSVDYQAMMERLQELKDHLSLVPDADTEKSFELNRKIDEQSQQIEAFKEDVSRLAKLFNEIPINTDRLKQARQLFRQGKFREAYTLLNAEDLNREQEQLLALEKEQKQALAETQEKLQANATEYLIKARLRGLNLENNNRIADTKKYFEKSIDSYELFENCMEYAVFLQFHNEEPDALKYYDKASSLAKDDDKLIIDHNTASIYLNRGDFPKAKGILEGMRTHIEKNKENLSLTAFNLYPGVLLDLGIIATKIESVEKGEKLFALVEEVCLKHLDNFNYFVSLSYAYLQLARIWEVNDFTKAEKLYLQYFDIRSQIYQQDPNEYCSLFAEAHNELCVFYKSNTDYFNAKRYGRKALRLYKKLSEINPMAFQPGLSRVYQKLGNAYLETSQLEEAIKHTEKALHIFKHFYDLDAEKYGKEYARILHNLAVIYHRKKRPDKAQKHLTDSLKIKEKLVQFNRSLFIADLAMSYNLQGVIYIEDNRPDLASKHFRIAEEIYEETSLINDFYLKDFVHCCINQAQICIKEKDFDGAIGYYTKTYDLLNKYIYGNKHKYYPLQSDTINKIAWIYFEHKSDYEPLKPYLEEAFTIGEEFKDSQLDILKHSFNIISDHLALVYKYTETPEEENKLILNQDKQEYEKRLAIAKAKLGFFYINYTEKKIQGYSMLRETIQVLPRYGNDPEVIEIIKKISNSN